MTKKKITAVKNGPLIVENVQVLKSQSGKPLETFDTFKLCRCGESLDKPYCDGMHDFFEFDDSKDEHRTPDQVDVYEGKLITIYENKAVCSHKGICYGEMPEVWKMDKSTRIDANAIINEEMVKTAIDICKRCPSGALSFSLPGEKRNLEAYPSQGEIQIAPRQYGYDGPYEVSGDIEFEDEDGNTPESKSHYVLCRCGKSKNMPFCTGEHWANKFIDENNDEEFE